MKKTLAYAFVFSHLVGSPSRLSVAVGQNGAPSNSGRLRVVMSTDFPPIAVVKGGGAPNDQKSDPDDMQSISFGADTVRVAIRKRRPPRSRRSA
jgi:hypothetical protein